jgi:tRNA threonylcarbamoyladenosine biosynthesis protein TsaE
MEWIAVDAAEMRLIAQQILTLNGQRRKFALIGNVGAGKTTLVQHFCHLLGVEGAVTSPTFALVNEYPLKMNGGKQGVVNHLDLYRLKSLEEALEIGIEDYLYNEDFCFIEWPELIESLLPEDIIRIEIEIMEESGRKVLFL